MTELLDLATSFKINAWFYLLMSLTTWLVLRRPALWPVRVWCLAGVLAGVSVWLISLRGSIGDVWTYAVAQPMLLASYLTYAQAMRMDIGRAWSWRVLGAVVVAYALVMAYGFEHRHAWGMAVLVRTANSAALVALTVSAVALARHERSRNALFMVLGFALFTASMLTNLAVSWMGRAVLHVMQQGVFNHVMGLVSLLTILMVYMGYLGLALERVQRSNLQLRQAQWQAQQWREQAHALTLLDRQRTLSVLANSLGHDILQPLSASKLNAQLARRMVQAGTVDAGLVAQTLERAVDGLRRSAGLIDRIRHFLRPEPMNPDTVRLQSVVQDARNLLRQELMYRGIELQVAMPVADVCVRAEVLPLTQALLQVLRNAMQAVQGRSRRVISMALQTRGNEACIEVLDSGSGFSSHLLDEPPTGAQPVVDGLGGLGLYMTRGILTQFQGQLSLDNHGAGGARVRLILPLAQPAQA